MTNHLEYETIVTDNGNTKTTQLRNGVKHGTMTIRSPDGKILEQGTYNNGQLDGVYKEYYQCGKLKMRENYKDNKQHGQYTFYFEVPEENGVYGYTAHFVNGVQGISNWLVHI